MANVRIINLLLTLGVASAIAGCSGNLGVADEMLEPAFPEVYTFSADPQQLWQAVTGIIDTRYKEHILVRDPDSLIVSWVERILGETNQRYESTNANRLHQAEILEVGSNGTAITTIYVTSFNNGSKMRIRRVYYGPLTQPTMVHSHGDFAHYFQDLVKHRIRP